MLIWGPIQFLVIVRGPTSLFHTLLIFLVWQIAGEIFDTLDRLNEIGECLENCLERFKYHTIGPGSSGPVRVLLVKFYAHIIQFVVTASQTYSRSKSSTTPSFYVCAEILRLHRNGSLRISQIHQSSI
jgi:hypothetical protein